MDEWASYLSLTDAQKEQIRGILKDRFAAHHGDWKDAREKGKRVFETFRTDHFVLDELAPPMDAKAKASAMTDHFVGVAEAVLPVLTPEQRTLAAKKLREKAEGGTADEME